MTLPDFPSWFRALWGHEPFPWQTRLAKEAAAGQWPTWITLPTGIGKTSVIDIAVYLLASQAHLPTSQRSAPVRIVFAVNRRIVVDEAFRRARQIASRHALACAHLQAADLDPDDCLDRARLAVLAPVADALRAISGDPAAPPLETYPLRGATFTNRAWARSPLQPLVISTTLDQLGSRLLFRGYGCSEGARPTHAALFAYDSLLLLDEAHTSLAFSETLQAVEQWREQASEPLNLPFHTIQLTATPPADATDRFALLPEERSAPVIRQRLQASKPVRLREVVGASKKDRHKKVSEAAAEEISRLLEQEPAIRRILIVVNRVSTARLLQKNLKIADCTAELLVGGLRPLDREALVQRIVTTHQLQSSSPDPAVPRLVLVATQCVEVGADLDFDALITELAPLDSLRQRFGRLNRYGRAITAPATILAPAEALTTGDPKTPDPLYGTCLPRVWTWLKENETGLDFGINALEAILPPAEDLSLLLAPQAHAPILLPAHLDLLSQTSPAPHVEPEVSLYIHGPQEEFPSVGIVVRSGLDSAPLEVLEALPPLNTEAASISLFHAKRWLAGEPTEDTDTPTLPGNQPIREKRELPPAWLHQQGKCRPLINLGEIHPGDVLIFPEGTPGLAELIPTASEPPDQLEAAHLLARDKFLLVLSPERLSGFAANLSEAEQAQWNELLAPITEAVARALEEGTLNPACEREWKLIWPAFIKHFGRRISAPLELLPETDPRVWNPKHWRIEAHPAGGIIARGKTRVGSTPWPLAPEEVGLQGNFGSPAETADEVSELDAHQQAVERQVALTCQTLGLTEALSSACLLAARYHDLGKLDPRFQAWLHGCDPWAVAGKSVIAKSSYPYSQSRRYQRLSNTPAGFRHELLSTQIIANSKLGTNHPELDLLLHLIASHHGYCRAFAPVVPDTAPEDFTAEVEGESVLHTGSDTPLAHPAGGVSRRFWALTRRFGWWGLAYLETVLRLADQRASQEHSTSHY